MNTDLSSKIAKMLQDKHGIMCDNRTAKRVALAAAYGATEDTLLRILKEGQELFTIASKQADKPCP